MRIILFIQDSRKTLNKLTIEYISLRKIYDSTYFVLCACDSTQSMSHSNEMT